MDRYIRGIFPYVALHLSANLIFQKWLGFAYSLFSSLHAILLTGKNSKMALVSWLVQKFNRCGDATDMKEHQPVLTLTLDCDSAIAFIKLCLFEKGFQAQQRFGLTSACATFSDPVCPHSPDQLCNCQLITLQVCRSDLPGIPIILHGHDKLTEIYYMEEDTVPEDVLAALKQAELRIQ